jgi:phosphohistidine phosphatase
MRLYLMRHGKAEKKSPTGRDEDRPLQPRGERQSRWMGHSMLSAAAEERPALILASPAARADQTARLLHSYIGCTLKTEQRLALGNAVEDVLELIRTSAAGEGGFELGRGSLVLVGHNPQLEILLPTLVAGLSADESEMRTGEAALLEVPAGAPLEGAARLLRRMRSPD